MTKVMKEMPVVSQLRLRSLDLKSEIDNSLPAANAIKANEISSSQMSWLTVFLEMRLSTNLPARMPAIR